MNNETKFLLNMQYSGGEYGISKVRVFTKVNIGLILDLEHV